MSAESTWLERLHNELDELRTRIDRLKKFVLSGSFESLPEVDRRDLREQLTHMENYFNVLMRRVSRQCNNA